MLNVIKHDEDLQTLLQKKSWSSADRYMWESQLSQLVGDRIKQVDGLSEYRTDRGDSHSPTRHKRMNNISQDIVSKGKALEFDCEQMSISQIVVMQSIEDSLLSGPKKTPHDQNLKFAGQYFYTGGALKAGFEHQGGGHAFIISSVSGNVVESTLDRKEQYYRQTNGSFIDFVAGKTLVTSSNEAYGSRWSRDDESVIQQRIGAINRNNTEDLERLKFTRDSYTGDALTEAIAIKVLRDARNELRVGSEPNPIPLPKI